MDLPHRQGLEGFRHYFEKNRSPRRAKLVELWISYLDRDDITQADIDHFLQGYREAEPEAGSAGFDLLSGFHRWASEKGFTVE